MVTSNAIQQQHNSAVAASQADKIVQVAEAYSYLSDQKEINLDSIPLPLSPPPPPPQATPVSNNNSNNNNQQPQEQSANILEQTIIKQKRLARFKNTDLRRKILLKRTFDLVCEIMDHENGFDFEDETETINKREAKSQASNKSLSSTDDDEEEDDGDDDDDSDSSSSGSSDSDSSDDDDSSSDSSSSSSDEESDEEEEEEDELRRSRPSKSDGEIDQLIPRPSESPKLKIKLAWDQVQAKTLPEPSSSTAESKGRRSSFTLNSDSQVVLIGQQQHSRHHATADFSVVIQSVNEEELDFTELNSIDISENYDDSAFNLDQVTYVDDEQPSKQLHELKTFRDDSDTGCHASVGLKRKRNSFEETVHQNEQDLLAATTATATIAEACSSSSDQQILCANPSLASLSDSTCFYNNQPPSSNMPLTKSALKRPSDDDRHESGKRLKLSN